MPPDVFDGITSVECHVFYNVDALNTGWVRVVAGWMVDLLGLIGLVGKEMIVRPRVVEVSIPVKDTR